MSYKVCHVSRITLSHQEECSTHKQKILPEKIFKIGILKVCGIDFKDSLLCRQISASVTAVVQTTLPYMGENL